MKRIDSEDGIASSDRSRSPIFVTGHPRSGTTFLQHLLSTHPNIEIFGQETADLKWGEWLRAAVSGVDAAAASNEELGYDVPHYAAPRGTAAVAKRLLEFVEWYLTGGKQVARWGVKSLGQCRVAPELVMEVWPDTRWVVCIRNPFHCAESLRNTFDRGHLRKFLDVQTRLGKDARTSLGGERGNELRALLTIEECLRAVMRSFR